MAQRSSTIVINPFAINKSLPERGMFRAGQIGGNFIKLVNAVLVLVVELEYDCALTVE
jgi:hypothetical protein